MSDAPEGDLDPARIIPWVEFCAWSSLVMIPIIWWLQGPSVSSDQFVVRTGSVVISACVAIGIRGWAVFQRPCTNKMAGSPEADPDATKNGMRDSKS